MAAEIVEPDTRETSAAQAGGSLKSDTLWTGLDILVSSGLAFIFRLVLARVLLPADFGVIAIATTAVAVVSVINDFGLSAALIQRKADRFSSSLVDTAFTVSLAISAAMFLINGLIVAPVASLIFGSTLVGWVTAAIGLSFLVSAWVSIGRALLIRKRRYREVMLARVISAVIGLVLAGGWLLARSDVWTLVVQVVATQAALAVALLMLGSWRPRLGINKADVKETLGYSGLVFTNDLVVVLARNFDVLTLGRMLAQSQVGLYSLAFYITDVVRTNLMTVLNRVMFTHYSTLQDQPEQVRKYYVRTLFWNSVAIFPIMITLILFGPGLMTQFLGEAWRGMGAPLQVLALSVMIHTAGGTTSTIYKALGRPGLDLSLFLFTSVLILLPALVLGTYLAGILGAAVAVALNKLIAVVIRQVFLDRMVGATAMQVGRALAIALLCQLPIILVAIVGRAAWPGGGWVRDLVLIAVALTPYYGVMALKLLKDR